MSFVGDLLAWFTAADTWTGERGMLALIVEHLQLAGTAMLFALALALPPAVWLAHRGRGRVAATVVANTGRALPSFGIIVLAAVLFIQNGLPFRFWPLIIALVILAVPPLFTNAYTGVASVDRQVVEAARGLGATEREVLRGVELPLGMPLIVDGIRLAAVQVVATTALGAVVAPTGGLGRPIVTGFSTLRTGGLVPLVGASVLVALLTIVVDRLVTLARRRLVPEGVRRLAG